MLKYMYTTSTLAFDSFGDIILEGGDLKYRTTREGVLLQALTDFLKTTAGDYFFNPTLGASYDQYIGLGITPQLVKDIANKIETDIINLGIIPEGLFKVYSLHTENTIQVRIILFEDDDYTIKLSYDPSLGVTIGH